MKILLIHTYYQIRGGEDQVFEQEAALLRNNNDVATLCFHNKGGIKGALQFFASIWNLRAAARVRRKIRAFQPDIVHIHNCHFAAGPIILWTCHRMQIKVILTLHNYRLLCPSGTLMVNGQLFLDSVPASFPWKAVAKKVYRNSHLQTFWLASVVWFHRQIGTWRLVERYIVLTPFAKGLYEGASLEIAPDKIVIKPNFTIPASFPHTDAIKRKHFFLFVGRLSEEKGITVLLKAFKDSPYELHIAGDGPFKNEVLQAEGKHIKYLGRLNMNEVLTAMNQCSALLFTSIWYEGMPMTILEAFSLGTPVIASNIGAMSTMVRDGYNGLHFEPNNISDLQVRIAQWVTLPEGQKSIFCENAYYTYEEYYAPETNLNRLLSIYNEALL